MDALEWIKASLRWVHVFAAILWIGNTWLFNFFEKNLERDADTPENISGRLWMVHGGGFYNVEKQKLPEVMPRTLHWFKWEAAITWISGFLLIVLYYYHGGLLVEPEMSKGAGIAAGVVTLVGGWLVYDLLVTSPLGKQEEIVAAIGLVALTAITYVLGFFLSPRATYIHVGGMLGTIMAANVWMRILPSQTKMLAAAKEGKKPEVDASATGPLRSKHNTYLVVPLVLLMISNHYPTIHGSKHNWAYLAVFLVVGWAFARWFRGPTKAGEGAPTKEGQKPPMWRAALSLGLLAGALGAGLHWAPKGDGSTTTPPPPKPTTPGPTGGPTGARPAPLGAGVARGVVGYTGEAPAAEPWGGAAHGECKTLGSETLQLVKVSDAKLADVFVYVSAGLPDGTYPTPSEVLTFDQHGCEFAPRVFGVMVDQEVEIGNSDRLMHNVKSPEFNQGFPFGSKRKLRFQDPGVMITIKCDVHPWMRSYAGVMEHPYFATTGADGAFEIKGLVAGDYTLSSWHEKLGAKETKLHIDEAKPVDVELSYP